MTVGAPGYAPVRRRVQRWDRRHRVWGSPRPRAEPPRERDRRDRSLRRWDRIRTARGRYQLLAVVMDETGTLPRYLTPPVNFTIRRGSENPVLSNDGTTAFGVPWRRLRTPHPAGPRPTSWECGADKGETRSSPPVTELRFNGASAESIRPPGGSGEHSGTVTDFLEQLVGERIDAEAHHHETVSAPSPNNLGVPGGEPLLHRAATLRGRASRSPYVYAKSVIVTRRLSTSPTPPRDRNRPHRSDPRRVGDLRHPGEPGRTPGSRGLPAGWGREDRRLPAVPDLPHLLRTGPLDGDHRVVPDDTDAISLVGLGVPSRRCARGQRDASEQWRLKPRRSRIRRRFTLGRPWVSWRTGPATERLPPATRRSERRCARTAVDPPSGR